MVTNQHITGLVSAYRGKPPKFQDGTVVMCISTGCYLRIEDVWPEDLDGDSQKWHYAGVEINTDGKPRIIDDVAESDLIPISHNMG